MVISFGGWTPTAKRMNEVTFADIFDTVYEDDGNNVYVTKKEYEYPGGEIPTFKYKYLLDVKDIKAYDRETNKIYINLYMVPYHDEDLQKYAETEPGGVVCCIGLLRRIYCWKQERMVRD